MDTKNRIRIIALAFILGLPAGAGIATIIGGIQHRGASQAGDIFDRRAHDLEQGLAGKDRDISGTLEGARSEAQDLILDFGGIGENADRTHEYLEDIAGILEELRKRGQN